MQFHRLVRFDENERLIVLEVACFDMKLFILFLRLSQSLIAISVDPIRIITFIRVGV